MENLNKIILTDVDGVMANWEFAFNTWMQENGHKVLEGKELTYDLSDKYGITKDVSRGFVKEFNNSPAIGFLPALRDAEFYIRKLHFEHDYKFHVITSLTKEENACRLRTQNLRKLFGDNTFDRFVYLDIGADKDEALEEYRDTGLFWIEDKIENAEAGLNVGLRPILMEHGHNMHYVNPGIVIKKNWYEIYNYILEKEKENVD